MALAHLLVSALLAGPAGEPKAGFEVLLEWRAPPSCPDAEASREAVEEMLGRSMNEAARRNLRFEVAIDESGDRHVARLEVADANASSERALADSSCVTLAEALAFIIASTIDPDVIHPDLRDEEVMPAEANAGTSSPADTDPGVASPPVEADPADTAEPPRPRSDQPRLERPELRLGAAGLGTLASLPGPAIGTQLTLGVDWRRFRVDLVGAYEFPRSAAVDDAGADIALARAGVEACYQLAALDLRFPICVGGEFGALRASPFGTDSSNPVALPWVAASAGGGLSWSFQPRFALIATLRGRAPITRPTYRFDDGTQAFASGPVAAQLALGLEARIW